MGVCGRVVLGRQTEERGDDRLFSRPQSTSVAEVHWAMALGRRPADRGVVAAGRHGVGRVRWRHRFRSLGLQKTRQGLGGRSTAECGRYGKIDNCQVGIYLGYVSRKEHALVDVRLYLNKDWAKDKKRRKKCGVPEEIRFRTRHALALEMLAEHGTRLPHAWIAGDDEMGRSSAFRRDLRGLGEQYLLAVPSNTLVRDLEAEAPEYCGRGRRPQVPFVRADRWREALPKDAWTTIDVRDGARGPLVVQAVKVRVQAKTDRRRNGPEEILVILREEQSDGTMKHDYYLSNAVPETALPEFARVAKAEHRIEECLGRAKSDAGLAQYQVRNWVGWHHHQTLSILATWFLTQEDRRGKKIHTGSYGPDGPRDHCRAVMPRSRLRLSRLHRTQEHPHFTA